MICSEEWNYKVLFIYFEQRVRFIMERSSYRELQTLHAMQ